MCRLLSDLDLTALAMYCRVHARWLEAERRLEESGELVFETQSGYQTQSAYLNIINQCLKQMQSIMAEFGMTPATRVSGSPITGIQLKSSDHCP